MPTSNFNELYRDSVKKMYRGNFEDMTYPDKVAFGTLNLSSIILSKLTNCPLKDSNSRHKKIIYINSSYSDYCSVFSNHLSFLILASRFMRKLGYLLDQEPPVVSAHLPYLSIAIPKTDNLKDYETIINHVKDLILLFKRTKFRNIGNNCKTCDIEVGERTSQNFLVYPQFCRRHFDRIPFKVLLEFYKNPSEDFNWSVELNSRSSDFLPFLMGLRNFKSDHIVRGPNCIFCKKKIDVSAWFAPNICMDCSVSRFNFNKFRVHYMNKVIDWKDFFKGKYKFYLNFGINR